MEIKEMIKMINPQGWKIDKVKGNYIIYGNKRNHYPTRFGQGWKPDWTSANENKNSYFHQYCIINKFNKITEFTF